MDNERTRTIGGLWEAGSHLEDIADGLHRKG